MRKMMGYVIRVAGTLVLLIALVGAGSCGLMSVQSVEFGNKFLAPVFFGICCVLGLLIKVIWTKPSRPSSSSADTPPDQ